MIIDMNFRGMRWQMPEVSQGAEYATTAHNMYRINSALEPLKSGDKSDILPTSDFSLAESFHLHDDKLVASESRLDWATTQVSGDLSRRLYYVENGLLQFLPYDEIPTTYPTPTILGHRSGVEVPLGEGIPGGFQDGLSLPAPYVTSLIHEYQDEGTAEPYISYEQLPDDEKDEYIETTYVYTYVNKYGEEGPPSLPSAAVYVKNNTTEVLIDDLFHTVNPDVVGVRVYALVNGSFFRIPTPDETVAATLTTAEIPNLTLLNDVNSYIHPAISAVFSSETVLDELISQEWEQAPEGVKHLADLDNGVLAVADDHDIYLSEPYYWHAFPEINRYTVTGTIQRIANIGGGMAVMTDRGTQFFFGSSPDSMIQSSINFPYSISDPDSFMPFDGGGIYVCHDGIAMISASGGQIMTDGWIDRDSWREHVDITDCRLGMYEGRVLMATRNPENSEPIGYCFNLSISEVTSFDIVESALKSGFFRDPRTNDVSYVADAVGLSLFNRGDQLVAIWESGDIWLPRTMSLSSLYVESEEYPVTVKVTPKDRTMKTLVVTKPRPRRMPVTGRAKSIRVRVESGQQVGRCALATDLRGF